MASNSGTLTRSSGTTRDFPWTIAVTEGSPSVANNTSVLSFTATVHSNTTAQAWGPNLNNPPQLAIYWHNSNTNTNTLVASATYPGMAAGETKTLTGTLTVTHQSDGSGKGYAYATWTKNASTNYVPNSATLATAEFNLTTIARSASVAWSASSVTVQNTSGNAVSFSFTAISGLSYTAEVTLGDSVLNFSMSSVSGTQSRSIAKSWILTSLHNSLTGEMKVKLTTRSGSTSVGTSTATCSVTIDRAYFKPSVSLGNVTGTLYAGRSSATLPVTTTNSYGASSVTTKVTADNRNTVTPASSTTTGSAVNFTIATLAASSSGYSLNFIVTATDSRNVSVEEVYTVTVNGWSSPTARINNAYRTESATSTSEDAAGTYVYVTYSTSTFDGNGTVSCKYYRNDGTSGTIASGGHFTLPQEQSVHIELIVTDSTGQTAIDTADITFAVIPLQLYQSSDGLHVGAAIGASAQADRFDIGLPIYMTSQFATDLIVGLGKTESDDGVQGAIIDTYGDIQLAGPYGCGLALYSWGTNSSPYNIYEVSKGTLQLGGAVYIVRTLRIGTGYGIYTNGKASQTDGVAGANLGSNGTLTLTHATNPQVYMMCNGATSLDTTAQNTDVLRMGAYQMGYNQTWAKNSPALLVNGAVCGYKGVFWNGKPCVYAQDSTYVHTYSMSWDGTHMNFYVDGTLQKSL